jgi:hypothetical protein
MKHPARNDFDTILTEAGATVTFKPTNSVYSFYKLADASVAALPGPVSLDTEDYLADEVKDMAQRIASEVVGSVSLIQNEEVTESLTTVRPMPGDRGD